MNPGLVHQSWAHAASAFLGMGTWALLANRDHSGSAMLLAAAVQGSTSAGLTLAMKGLIQKTVRRLQGPTALILSPALCGLLSASLLAVIHKLSATPELLATIAVPVAVSTGYAASYSLALVRLKGVRGRDGQA